MSGPLALEFVMSAASVDQLPAAEREIALVGRSNVGKSSLLNALANRNNLARTSKTPGATKLLNVFELAPPSSGRWIVDLPGYGYAKTSKADQARMAEMIDGYLQTRGSLDSVIVLIDGEVGPTSLDLQSVEWFEHLGIRQRFVATKADKVRPSKSKKRRTDLVERLGVPKSEVTWVSAAKGTGVPELRSRVHGWLTE